MINCLSSLINQEGSLSFGEACIYALIGFALIFIGIILIILIIKLIGIIMQKTDNLAFLTKKKGRKQQSETISELSDSDNGEVPDEVKAAIIAAVMAYYSAEKSKCDFKVKRIRRI